MKIAEKMNLLTISELELLKNSILKEIEEQATLRQFDTSREFSYGIDIHTKNELVKYLISEGFTAQLLNNNSTIYVNWDLKNMDPYREL